MRRYLCHTVDTDVNQIVRILSKSPVFMAVKKGNPVLMYDGYSANLLEIVDELKPYQCVMIRSIRSDIVRIMAQLQK